MTTYLPTLKQLQYLVALHEQGHFGRAAEASFVSQSTLSAGIRELESLLGTTLVERSRRVVRFTALGENVVERARRILREASDLEELVRASGTPLSGELRLAVIPTIAPFLLPRLLPRLRETRPALELKLREDTSAAAVGALHAGRVDCVLLALPFAVGEVERESVGMDRLGLAIPAAESDAFADPVQPDSIDGDRLLLLQDGHCLREHALAACSRPELRAAAPMVGTSLHTLVQMVDNGLGLTMVPDMAVRAGLLDNTRVVLRTLESDDAHREIALIWRTKSPRADEFRLLAGEIRAELAQ